jgi:hypothetical protein
MPPRLALETSRPCAGVMLKAGGTEAIQAFRIQASSQAFGEESSLHRQNLINMALAPGFGLEGDHSGPDVASKQWLRCQRRIADGQAAHDPSRGAVPAVGCW